MKIPYGTTFIDIQLPKHIEWQVLKKDVPFSFPPQLELVQEGVKNLIQQLRARIVHRAKLLLVVPDHTRKCNLPFILPPLIDALQSSFSASIEILIANGSHVLQPENVIRELVSEKICNSIPTSQHNAKDESQLAYFGITRDGTEIWLNKKVKEADFIITIGGILYHYFAGFGGGPKMLLPGVAGYETIRRNHSRTIDSDSGGFHVHSREGEIKRNPVHTDLSQVLEFVPNVLSLQVALSADQKIIACKAGPVLETQQALLPLVKNLYGVHVGAKADVVVAGAGGFPSDVNLIQVHKSIRHAFQFTRKNGALIMFAECSEGIGSSTFLPYFKLGSSKRIAERLAIDFQINGQTALSLKERAEQVNIVFVSELDATVVRSMGMTPCNSREDALSLLAADLRRYKTGVIMPQAAMTVPIAEN